MSRARWLALGSAAALVGCSGAVVPATQDGGDPHRDASPLEDASVSSGDAGERDAGLAVEASADSDSDSGAEDAGAACSSRSGSFACAGETCDRAQQLCDMAGGGCVAYDAPTPHQMLDAGSCGACPSCGCIQPTLYGNCHCQEDNAGTVVISCAGCYGAPPARIDDTEFRQV
jgi:hypothetical protein